MKNERIVPAVTRIRGAVSVGGGPARAVATPPRTVSSLRDQLADSLNTLISCHGTAGQIESALTGPIPDAGSAAGPVDLPHDLVNLSEGIHQAIGALLERLQAIQARL